MSTGDLAASVAQWVRFHGFPTPVKTHRSAGQHVVEFVVRTTKTRASSMVTRVGLLAAELLVNRSFSVGKELTSAPPMERADLATWKIFVRVDVLGKRMAA